MQRHIHAHVRACLTLLPSRERTTGLRAAAVIALCAVVFVALIPDQSLASSWNPTVVVRTEAFETIDDLDTNANVELRFGDSLNEKLIYDRGNARFRFSKSLYIAGNLTITGATVINTDHTNIVAPDAGVALEVLGTVSGSALTISSLKNCDTIDTNGNGVLACGTDGGGAGGISQTDADNRYVNTVGDAMTGALMIKSGNPKATADAGLMLEVAGSASGRLIHAQDRLESSGSLVVNGTIALNRVNYTWPATPAAASGKVLKVNPATGQLSWSADQTGGGGGPSTVVSTANVSDSTTTGTNNVTGLTVPVSASTNYIIRCLLTTASAATTTGVQITVNGPASPTQVTWNRQSCATSTTLIHANINAFGTEDVRTASAGTTRCIEPVRIHLRNGANAGNVTFSVDTEIGASAVTVYTGSFCDYQSY